jgi:hypothetical protein
MYPITNFDKAIDKIGHLHDGISLPPAWSLGYQDREYQFFDLIQEGPRIGKHWLAAFILVDDTCCMIWGQHPMISNTSELESILSSENAVLRLKSETTEAEFKVLEGWKLLRECAKKILDKTADPTTFKDDFADIMTWFTTNLPTQENASMLFEKPLPSFEVLPSTHLLQRLYLTGEIIWASMQFFLIRLPSILRESETRLKKKVDLKMASSAAVQLMQAMLNISEILTSMRNKIDKDSRKGILNFMEMDLGKNILSALGESDAVTTGQKYYLSVRATIEECMKVNASQRKWIWSSTGGQTILAPVWKGKK